MPLRPSVALSCLVCALSSYAANILVETESFTDYGGWTADAQFIDEMGSTYLLAHGLGEKLTDATTEITLPESGRYHVYARAYNWTSPWHKGKGPGSFRIAVDGRNLKAVLGDTGDRWEWQYAGSFKTNKKTVTLSLRDLTGFDGRCDAVYLTTDPGDIPPVGGDELASFRKTRGQWTEPVDKGMYDLVVVGGGIAGMHAAVAAARLGSRVALVQNRPVLGGNNSSEIRVHLGGALDLGRYPALGTMLKEYAPTMEGNAQPAENYGDNAKLAWIESEPGISLYLDTHVNKVEKGTDGRITSVTGVETLTGSPIRFSAPLFCDATGDGTIGFLAGADYLTGREGRDDFGEPSAPEQPDAMTMGASVQWRSREAAKGERAKFPEFSYGLEFSDETCHRTPVGEWTWETGMHWDQLNDFERVRDYGMLVAYSNWSYVTNRLGLFANRKLDWVASVGGKRETRRLLGDYILKEDDLVKRVHHEDASFTATWSIDLHFPDPENSRQFPDGPFIASNRHVFIHPYGVPYRCLYSRNVPNLFMAGRDISCTHVALGTVRVMRTTAMMGEVVGMAASLCRKHAVLPRDIYQRHLPELKALMTSGTAKRQLPDNQRYNEGHHLSD